MDRYDFPFTQFSTFLLQMNSNFSSGSADETGGGAGGKPVEITVAPGPAMLPTFMSLSAVPLSVDWTQLNLSAQAQVTLQLRVSLSDLVQRLFAGLTLLGARKISPQGPGPAVGGPILSLSR